MTWNDDQLSLGKPSCMDTDTLIEWIYRQMETPEETKARHDAEYQEHLKTHVPGYISACCIRVGVIESNYIRSGLKEVMHAEGRATATPDRGGGEARQR